MMHWGYLKSSSWSLTISAVIVIICWKCSSATGSTDPTTATNLQRLSRAHLEFALSFFRHLTEDTNVEENVVISPRR